MLKIYINKLLMILLLDLAMPNKKKNPRNQKKLLSKKKIVLLTKKN